MRLDEISKPAADLSVELQSLARKRRAKDLNATQSCEAKIGERTNDRIGLRHCSGELSQRFDHENSRHHWLPRKMTGEKIGFAWHIVFSGAGFARIKLDQPIDETKLRSVRERGQGSAHEFVHFAKLRHEHAERNTFLSAECASRAFCKARDFAQGVFG